MCETVNIYIRNNFQKTSVTGEFAKDIFTDDVLSDLSQRVAGTSLYEVHFVDPHEDLPFEERASYNRGRLAYLIYGNKITIVTFTPQVIVSRNSPFQTLGRAIAALNELEENIEYLMYEKEIAYYFVHTSGSFDTDYAKFMFKVISTLGMKILNPPESLEVTPFRNVLELITEKNRIREKNSSNKSTHIILGSNSRVEVYAKTFGTNKYESAILAIACYNLVDSQNKIVVFEISDNTLRELPESVHRIFDWLGISYSTSDAEIRRSLREGRLSETNLRSPTFISNMLDVHGGKKCKWCECAVPEIIEAAHILPVSNIRSSPNRTLEEKYLAANDSSNGIWLCRNHHRLFDSGLAAIGLDFKVLKRVDLIDENYQNYINQTIIYDYLDFGDDFDVERARNYIAERNETLELSLFE